MNHDQSDPSHEHDPSIDALFWRDEILQIMFWLKGEGLASEATIEDIRQFLGVESNLIQFHLDEAVKDGYLNFHPDPAGMPLGNRYSLSEFGRKEGGRRFADGFSELTKPAHGECAADCDCHKTGNHGSCSHNH